MKMLAFMEDPLIIDAKKGNAYSRSVSARFFKFLLPYFRTVTIAAPARAIATVSDLPNNFSQLDKKLQVQPLPFFDGFAELTMHATVLFPEISKIAQTTVLEHDVIWLRLPAFSAFPFYRHALHYNKPLVIHVAGNIKNAWKASETLFSKLSAYFAGQLQHCITKHMLHSSVGLFTGSELFDLYKRSSDVSALFVDSQFAHSDIVGRDDCCIDPPISVLYVGQLRRSKGVIKLLESVKIARDLGYDVQLRIVGYGPLSAEIEKISRDSHWGKIVRFEGYIPFSEKLWRIYGESDIYAQPSTTYPEGFPRSILEAWAAGLPIIVTRVGGVPGLVTHMYDGLIVEPGSTQALSDTIIQIIEDESLRKKLIKHGTEAAYHYSSERQSQIVIAALKEKYPQINLELQRI